MSLKDVFAGFFVDEDRNDLLKSYGEAKEFCEWADNPAFERFVDWINAEAARPIPMRQEEMVAAAIRANTLREVSERLKRDARAARSDMKQLEGELRDARTDPR